MNLLSPPVLGDFIITGGDPQTLGRKNPALLFILAIVLCLMHIGCLRGAKPLFIRRKPLPFREGAGDRYKDVGHYTTRLY
jgi:hypothetical protein